MYLLQLKWAGARGGAPGLPAGGDGGRAAGDGRLAGQCQWT